MFKNDPTKYHGRDGVINQNAIVEIPFLENNIWNGLIWRIEQSTGKQIWMNASRARDYKNAVSSKTK